MIKLKLDSSKVLNAQNTFVSAWLPGFTQHPGTAAIGGKDDCERREESGRGMEFPKTSSPFLSGSSTQRRRVVIKQAGGAEGERRRDGEKGGKRENKDASVCVYGRGGVEGEC